MGAAATSIGFWNPKSFPRMYRPDTLIPNRPEKACADRNRLEKIECSPPARETEVPGRSMGDAVMMCMTPAAALGPYGAEPGPSETSMQSMSRSDVEMRSKELKRWEGMRPSRLSMIVRSVPQTPPA